MQGRILTVAGVTIAICSAPFVATLSMVGLALQPTWVAVALTETVRKVRKKDDCLRLNNLELNFLCHSIFLVVH